MFEEFGIYKKASFTQLASSDLILAVGGETASVWQFFCLTSDKIGTFEQENINFPKPIQEDHLERQEHTPSLGYEQRLPQP